MVISRRTPSAGQTAEQGSLLTGEAMVDRLQIKRKVSERAHVPTASDSDRLTRTTVGTCTAFGR